MRFLMTESDRYKSSDDDKLRLVKHAKPLLSGKTLRLRTQELDNDIFKSNDDKNLENQKSFLEFFCEFLHCT